MPKGSRVDTDIDRYSATARAVLGVKKPAKRLGELALYTAAAGSALALAPGADASIIYSGVRNITVHRVTSGYGYASVDLNANGQGDFSFNINSRVGSGGQSDIAAVFGHPGSKPGSYGSASFFNNHSSSLLKLAASSRTIGANYGPNTSLSHFGGMRRHFATASGFSTVGGLWNPGPSASSTGFVAVRIGSTNSTTKQFGWLHFRLATDAQNRTDSLTLIDWAYQSVPGEAIHVGDKGISVPEPSGLGLMALGALGLAALRRRRRGEKVDRAH